MFSEFDTRAMRRALELALRSVGTTHPNPAVGCVIAHGESIVGEGWTQPPGGPHAEVEALRVAGGKAAGATAYVTLEPCSHHGRTPPCSDALIRARLGRVVFSIQDPNPRVSGGGSKALEQAGIKVESGLLADEAAEINPGFLKRMRTGKPFVRVKLAMSLDGRTALANGKSQWITGEVAREDVQRWRARSSAVLTGIGTVLADNPRLDVRIPGTTRQPLRVVLDSSLRTPPNARLFESQGDVLILTRPSDSARATVFERPGIAIASIPASGAGDERLSLMHALEHLGKLEINEVLVEAGPTLAGAFVGAGLADELLVYVAPLLLGPQARPLVTLPELTSLEEARRLTLVETRQLGADVLLRLRRG